MKLTMSMFANKADYDKAVAAEAIKNSLPRTVKMALESAKQIVIEEGPRAYPNVDRIVQRIDMLIAKLPVEQQTTPAKVAERCAMIVESGGFLNDKSLEARFGKAAAAAIRRYDWEVFARDVDKKQVEHELSLAREMDRIGEFMQNKVEGAATTPLTGFAAELAELTAAKPAHILMRYCHIAAQKIDNLERALAAKK